MLWGLDEDGRFYGSATPYHSSVSQICGPSSKPNVYNIVIAELNRLKVEEERHAVFLESDAVSDRDKERRLINCFQSDLLPGISGEILASKCARDHHVSAVKEISSEQKYLGYAVIFSINVAMVVYIFLFALQQSKYRQSAWLQSFILWLLTEIVFVSTLTVVVLHIIVPSFIMKDIVKLREKVADIIYEYGVRMRGQGNKEEDKEGEQKADDGEFNATDFFFLSKKLAQRVPHLRAAQLIVQFRTPWPRQSYQHVRDVSKSYNRGIQAAIGNFVGTLLVFFLSSFVHFPHSVQDGVVHMVGTLLVGYIVVLHSRLFLIAPVLAFLPLFVIVIIAHFTYQFWTSNSRQPSNAVVPVSSLDHRIGDGLVQDQIGSLMEEVDRVDRVDSDISNSNYSVNGHNDSFSASSVVKQGEEIGDTQGGIDAPPLDEGSIYIDGNDSYKHIHVCGSLHIFFSSVNTDLCVDDGHESDGDNSADIRSLMETFQRRFIEEMTKEDT